MSQLAWDSVVLDQYVGVGHGLRIVIVIRLENQSAVVFQYYYESLYH